MKFKALIVGAVMAVLGVFGSLAVAQTTATGEQKVFSGTVEIHSTQVAFIGSAKSGSGVLEFQGGEHYFSISGLGVGGMGVQRINAVGAVYNLDDLSKFAGTYVEARTGMVAGTKGKGYLSLSNGNGVLMELKFSGKGLALSTGVDGMVVKLK